VQATYIKFTRSEHADTLRAQLLATGDRELVEAAPRARVWGIGYGVANAPAKRANWGQNKLGQALQEVRLRLQQEEKAGRAAQAKSNDKEEV
jgi:ribA/ribD-fused uncharacterized protein